MRIVHRYLILEIVKNFGMLLLAVVSIYLVVDFFEKSDNILEAGLPFSRALIFFLLNIPFIVSQIMPVAILLSVLITLGLMCRHNEILALKSSGMSLLHLTAPVVMLGAAAGMLLFVFSDTVVPATAEKAHWIWIREVKKKSPVQSRQKDIWVRGDRQIVNISYYDAARQTLNGVSVSGFDAAFRLVRKIDAKKGRFADGTWVLENVLEQTRVPGDGFNVAYHPRRTLQFDFSPADLTRVAKRPEAMRFAELQRYTRKMENEGYDVNGLRVDLNAKPALPAVCIIMCLFGVGIALGGGGRRGVFFNVTVGIGATFCYWIFYSFCLSLGYGGMLPPFAAAWIANLVFGCIGGLMLVRMDR